MMTDDAIEAVARAVEKALSEWMQDLPAIVVMADHVARAAIAAMPVEEAVRQEREACAKVIDAYLSAIEMLADNRVQFEHASGEKEDMNEGERFTGILEEAAALRSVLARSHTTP